MSADPRPLKVVGRRLPKVDAWSKVTGTAQYADDLSFPRMLFGRLVRCPHPHARIVEIDTSAAESVSGVAAVITGADISNPYGVLPISEDEYGLSPDKGRFVGDPVAAIAGRDEAVCDRAARRLRVRYEVLPTHGTVEAALSGDGEPIHPVVGRHGRPNVHKAVSLEFGDLDGGFDAADLAREDVFHYAGNTHFALETHACVAVPEPEGGLTLWSSTQTPHYVQRSLAKALGIPAHTVRVIVPALGGGFGGKAEALPHEIAAAKLALVTGRPVKIRLTREEVFYTHRGRHPVTMSVRAGCKNDGMLTGLHVRTVLDGGAYGSYGVATTYYTGALAPVTYRVPAYGFEGARVYTNKPPCGPKRGHGTPQPRFGVEIMLDKLARDLDMCPAELRYRNLVTENTRTVNHLRITSCGLRQCIEAVVEASDFKARHRQLPDGAGLGLACSTYLSGAALPVYWNELPHSAVIVQVDRFGRVTALCGATDIGQGSDSVLAAFVGEVLGLEPHDIHLVTADTALTPVDLGSYSSRVTFMMGNAALSAARGLREQIVAAVALEHEVLPEDLDLCDGAVVAVRGAPFSIPWPDAVRLAEAGGAELSATGSYRPPDLAGPYKGSGVGPSPAYSYSACVVEVDVDSKTGLVVPRDVWLAHDIGRAINPTNVEGQIEGGVYMGLGEALMEEQAFLNGLHAGPSALEYKTPTTFDMPRIHTMIIETDDPEGPMGAKEAGQGPLLPVPPAVANAVFDAVGVRIDEVPITPGKVHRALQLKARGRSGRVGPSRMPDVVFPPPVHVDPPADGAS